MVTVNKLDENTFEVTVESAKTTSHKVYVKPAYYQKLTGGKVSAEELVKKSFQFLLERESNTSILGTFELSVIQQYFPEYEQTIGKLR